MTEQAYRDLDVAVAKVLGHKHVTLYQRGRAEDSVGRVYYHPMPVNPDEGPGGWSKVKAFHPDASPPFWGFYRAGVIEEVPDFTTDPAATAEVVRWIGEQARKDWDSTPRRTWVLNMQQRPYGPLACVDCEIIIQWNGRECYEHKHERIADHDGDPVRAQAVALCRTVLAVVKATETAQTPVEAARKAQESGK